RNGELAPAEVELAGLPVVAGEILRGQGVDDVAALLLVLDQPGRLEHAQVVGHVDDLDLQQLGQLADVLGAVPQALGDSDAVLLADRLQEVGTLLSFSRVDHRKKQPRVEWAAETVRGERRPIRRFGPRTHILMTKSGLGQAVATWWSDARPAAAVSTER